ncbi:MAG TPA: AAA family ATPase, partial [Thermoplasmataceae archaeon]|nr:AAA family ATPase [Thermoplasmataceae archaeon]
MKLIEVELRNFLSHSNTLVRFTDGINVITGPNGAGKSSIIDGIKYSIFGRRERGRGSLQEELIKKGSRDMSVRTTFIMGGHTYEIFRSVSLGRGGAKPTVAYLKRNGQTIASTVSGVEQQLEIELGIKSDVVLNSLFVGQGEMDSLISLSKAERQKMFGQILALDLLSEASDAIRDPIRRIDGILEESSGLSEELVQLRGNLVTESSKNSTLKGEVEELNSRLSSVSSQVEEIEERIRILNAGIAALQQQKKELEAKRLKRVEVNQEIQKIQHEIHTISERIERNSAKVDQKLLSMRDKIILA